MELKDKVEEILVLFCDNMQTFTSLDVSNTVKQEGFPGSRHRDIAAIVRDKYDDSLMSDWGYTRTLIDVELLNGLRSKAYLYHHNTISPSTYLDRSQVAIIPSPVHNGQDTQSTQDAAQGATQDATQDADQTALTETRHAKTDGRLEIPATWVRDLGWEPSWTIYIVSRDSRLLLLPAASVGVHDTVLVTTKITPDGRLRVPKTAFIKKGWAGETDFVTNLCDQRIEISCPDIAANVPVSFRPPTATFVF